jgi:hypothetical protein
MINLNLNISNCSVEICEMIKFLKYLLKDVKHENFSNEKEILFAIPLENIAILKIIFKQSSLFAIIEVNKEKFDIINTDSKYSELNSNSFEFYKNELLELLTNEIKIKIKSMNGKTSEFVIDASSNLNEEDGFYFKTTILGTYIVNFNSISKQNDYTFKPIVTNLT